jgi:hypothetical protein
LEYCLSLEEVYFVGMKNLKTLTFTKDMPKLKMLNLTSSSIESIVGLEHCLNLEELYLSKTQKYKTLMFTKDMSKLKNIYLGNSSIESIIGLEYCPNIEVLAFQNSTLKTLTFTKDMSKLKIINLYNSNIESIVGLGYCTNLEKLDLNSTKNLKTLILTKDMPKLELASSSSNEFRFKGRIYLIGEASNSTNLTSKLKAYEKVVVRIQIKDELQKAIEECTDVTAKEELQKIAASL